MQGIRKCIHRIAFNVHGKCQQILPAVSGSSIIAVILDVIDSMFVNQLNIAAVGGISFKRREILLQPADALTGIAETVRAPASAAASRLFILFFIKCIVLS